MIQGRTPRPHEGHRCRGECGGRLHGICGEVEDPYGDNSPLQRICPRCATTKRGAGDVSKTRAGKRKADDTRGNGPGQQSKTHDKSSAAADAKKTRTQLTLGQKFEMLKLLAQKLSHVEVARRYKCSARTVSNIAQRRTELEAEAASAARSPATVKRKRSAAFPEVRAVRLVRSDRCYCCTLLCCIYTLS